MCIFKYLFFLVIIIDIVCVIWYLFLFCVSLSFCSSKWKKKKEKLWNTSLGPTSKGKYVHCGSKFSGRDSQRGLILPLHDVPVHLSST